MNRAAPNLQQVRLGKQESPQTAEISRDITTELVNDSRRIQYGAWLKTPKPAAPAVAGEIGSYAYESIASGTITKSDGTTVSTSRGYVYLCVAPHKWVRWLVSGLSGAVSGPVDSFIPAADTGTVIQSNPQPLAAVDPAFRNWFQSVVTDMRILDMDSVKWSPSVPSFNSDGRRGAWAWDSANSRVWMCVPDTVGGVIISLWVFWTVEVSW